MAKRMLDTEIWSQRWFCDLSTEAKMLYFYFVGNCNHAGVLDLWDKRYKDDTGLSLSKSLKEMDGLIIEFNKDRFFMPRFIFDQYPDFPNSKVKAQLSAIKLIEKEQLEQHLTNPLERVSKPLSKGYGYGYGNGNGNGNEYDNSNKVDLQKNSSLPAVTKKRKSKYLSHDEFMERIEAEGKKQVKIGNGFVYLRPEQYADFVKEFGETMVREMILQLDLYKAQNEHYCGKELYVSDERVLRKSWVLRNAQQALSAKNSPVIQDIRKREKVAEEIRNNTEFFNPEPQE